MHTDTIVKMIKKRGVINAAVLKKAKINRTLLAYMAKRGILRRIARGLYTLADKFPKYESYASIMASAPKSVICLLSALEYHEITTQMPVETWVAIERRATKPKADNIRVVCLTGKSFTAGIESHKSDGLSFRVYCPAKTVVDCFKFRNKIGIDVAREALIDSLAQKKATRDEIWRYAKICRMTNVMRPYLEIV